MARSGTLNSTAFQASDGNIYYSVSWNASMVNKTTVKISWNLKTKGTTKQWIAAGYDLKFNGNSVSSHAYGAHYRTDTAPSTAGGTVLNVSGSFNVPLSGSSASFTIELRGRFYTQSSNYNINHQQVTASGMFTACGKPTLTITDNGNNTFRFKTVTGSNGTGNIAQNCYIYYTTNGATPTTSSKRIVTNKTAGQTFIGDYKITANTTVKAIAYTVAQYGNNTGSGVVTQNIKYYSKSTVSDLTVAYNTDTPLPDSEYTLTYKGTAGSNAPIKNYKIQAIINDKVVGTYETTNTSFTIKNLPLSENDTLVFIVQAISTNTAYNSDVSYTQFLTIGTSGGTIWVKISGIWEKGQAHIKVSGKWEKAKTVWIKATEWSKSK